MVGYFPLEFRILRFGILYKRNPNPISKWFTERESFTLFGELNLKIKLYLVAYVNLFRCDLNEVVVVKYILGMNSVFHILLYLN